MSKKYKIKWTSNAKEDLLTIVDYINQESAENARKVYKQIRDKAHSSNLFPLRGRVVPELQKVGITAYRELLINRWRIVYQIRDNSVYIMAIFDSRQNVEDILLQKIFKNKRHL